MQTRLAQLRLVVVCLSSIPWIAHGESSTDEELMQCSANVLAVQQQCTAMAETTQQQCTSNTALVQQQCSSNAASMLQQCTANALSLQQQCTPDAKLECDLSVATMQQQCSSAAASMQLQCGNTASVMQQQCSNVVSAMQLQCTGDAVAMQQHCGGESPTTSQSANPGAPAVPVMGGGPTSTNTNIDKGDPITSRVTPSPPPSSAELVVMQGREFFGQAEKKGLVNLLEENDGFIQVKNLFTKPRANSILNKVSGLSDASWVHAKSEDTSKKAATRHNFYRHHGKDMNDIQRMFEGIEPNFILSLGAGMYKTGGHIEDHNDLSGDTLKSSATAPSGKTYRAGTKRVRKVAVVYYLTRDWREDCGGLFTDLASDEPRTLVPEFNTMLLFTVPRQHNVTLVNSGCPNRYSVFGWFITEGDVDVVRAEFEKQQNQKTTRVQ